MSWISGIGDKRSFTGGVILLIYSVGLVLYALENYQLGTLSYMGPGMFPALVGSVLSLLAIFVIFNAVGSRGTDFHIEWRSLLAVLGSVGAFALLIEPFGLIPSIVVMTAISSFAAERLGLRATALLAVAIAVLTVGIFHYGLKLRFEIIAWPF